jgi:NADPH-dependent 2,4-dienoyl-CoA reductase/sulfur reductase-like enzyme
MQISGKRIVCAAALVIAWLSFGTMAGEEYHHEVIIVGSGISGLSAALELARSGIDVAVIEMSHHYGGAALVSEGRICIIGTPEYHNDIINLQKRLFVSRVFAVANRQPTDAS